MAPPIPGAACRRASAGQTPSAAPWHGSATRADGYRAGTGLSCRHAPGPLGTRPHAGCDGSGRLTGPLPDLFGRGGEPTGYVALAERPPGDELPERGRGAVERGVVPA